MYGQKNFPDIQGMVSPSGRQPIYHINQIGCFITSFCNFLGRHGWDVSPATMNAYLRNNRLFIDVDDGYYDDVAWDTITKFDPNTVVTKVGSGAPPNSDAIVKFVYNGGKTHFCLVNDVSTGTIVDSWDGLVKSWSVYGGPVAYACYSKKGVQNMSAAQDAEYRQQLLIQIAKEVSVNYKDGNSVPQVIANIRTLYQLINQKDAQIAELQKGVNYTQVGTTTDGKKLYEEK